MSANILRRAAAQIRVDNHNRYARAVISKRHMDYELAVADWLDDVAATHDDPYYRENYDDLIRPALAVAHTYLGEQP